MTTRRMLTVRTDEDFIARIDAEWHRRGLASREEAMRQMLDEVMRRHEPAAQTHPEPPFELISEGWLKANGFKWHQFDRQPDKHWLLWLGWAVDDGMFTTFEDLGLELAPTLSGKWFCWLRGDSAGRYHRFIHVRHLQETFEVVRLIEAMTGRAFKRENCMHGILRTQEQADRLRQERDRLDQRLLRQGAPWTEVEKDDAIGRPLIEHQDAHLRARKA